MEVGNDPSAAPTPHSSAVAELMRFLQIVWLKKLLLAFCIAVAGGLGFLFYTTATRKYESSADVLVLQTGGLSMEKSDRSMQSVQSQLPTYQKVLVSNTVLERAIRTLPAKHRIDLKGVDKSKWSETLRAGLSVSSTRQTNIISLRYVSRSPETSAFVVTAVVNAYLKFMDEQHKSNSRDQMESLTREKDELEAQLVTKEDHLHRLKSDSGLLLSGTGGGNGQDNEAHILVERAKKLNSALADAVQKPADAQAFYVAVYRAVESGGDIHQFVMQAMDGVGRDLFLKEIGLGSADVTAHTTSLGGGFGRREVDTTIYAAIMAKAVEGRPVKVTWSREEDVRHDTYRPAAKGRFRARLGEDGLPVALDMRIAAPSVIGSVMRRTFPSLSPAGPDGTITQGSHDQPYTIADYRVSGAKADLGVPVGFWRSVGNSFNGFFHEGFMDEIAAKGGLDPVDMRRKLMAAHPAAVKVVDKVAEMAKWGEALPAGTAKGFAFTLSFGSWVGEVVQVSDTPSGIRIDKVWIAADVGTAIDPGIIEAQLTSAVVFGLSAAMGQEITLAGGMVEQSNFHDFDALRIHQCPQFEVAILQNYHKMGGVGEIGTPPAAPALANALFALTGKRARRLPLGREFSVA